jgi:hypothetical protein
MKETKKVKEKTLAKEKVKGMFDKKITSGSSWAQ